MIYLIWLDFFHPLGPMKLAILALAALGVMGWAFIIRMLTEEFNGRR